MINYNIDVDLGLSGFNFLVQAENYLGAMIAALSELDKRAIPENNIDSLNISVTK